MNPRLYFEKVGPCRTQVPLGHCQLLSNPVSIVTQPSVMEPGDCGMLLPQEEVILPRQTTLGEVHDLKKIPRLHPVGRVPATPGKDTPPHFVR